ALKSGGGGGGAAPAAAAEAAAPAAASAPAPAPAQVSGGSNAAAAGGRVIASGLAKKEAGAQGIDLSALAGTGPGGRVVARDVEAAPKGGGAAAAAAAAAAPAKPAWTPAPGVVAATPM
ncbi:unnamed protein product, partial [Laminaria digitata]